MSNDMVLLVPVDHKNEDNICATVRIEINTILRLDQEMRTTLIVAGLLLAFGGQPIVAAQEPNPARAAVAQFGRIVSSQSVSGGDMMAWTVEKNGKAIVLYTPSDGSVVLAGLAWDGKTGARVSDDLDRAAQTALVLPRPPSDPVAATAPTAVRAIAAMDGEFKGVIPESMKTVDALAGVKEGTGGIADTVYIIIDVRCPICQQAYQVTRPYIKAGRTIKWIPTAALGDPENGVPLAATLLQSSEPAMLARMLSHREQVKTVATAETTSALSLNLAFLMAAFKQNSDQPAGVPAAFYIDRRTGGARMMTGVSEQVVIEDIFGKL